MGVLHERRVPADRADAQARLSGRLGGYVARLRVVVSFECEPNSNGRVPRVRCALFRALRCALFRALPDFVPGRDELLGAGINVTELTIAAQTVKASWPGAVVYWNEEWGPVVQNSSWPHPASALHSIPHAIDWISLDFYRTNPTAWETPEQEYAAQVYPKMYPHQRALQVPQAFGRKHDACGAVCYMNVSQHGCCTDNHGPGKPWASGQSNHSRAWWDAWSAKVATHYYSWAQRDPKIIGMNPW